jgi:hypothetical protein
MLGGAGVAGAEAPPSVALELLDCAQVDESEVRRVVAADLGFPLTDAARGASTHVNVGCGGERVEIVVDDGLTSKQLRRAIDLRVVPAAARSRLVAVAVSELISASWAELESAPRPEISVPPPNEEVRRVALATVARQRPVQSTRLRLAAFASSSAFFSGAGVLWGGGIRLGRDEAHRLGWALELSGAHGGTTTSLGTIAVDLVDVGASLALRHRASRWTVRGGPAVHGGAVHFGGTPDTEAAAGHGFWGPWLAAAVSAGLEVSLTPRLALACAATGGYVVVATEARAAGKPAAGINGPFVSLQLGIEWSP